MPLKKEMQNDIYQFTLFKNYSIKHGISTRKFGSMKNNGEINWENLSLFITQLGLLPSNFILGEQTHGAGIGVIENSIKHHIPSVDGLLTQKTDVVIGVVTADCVPVLLYDPKKNTVAAIHAGYKGVLAGIVARIVEEFVNQDSDTKNILVGIGPSIGPCCYDVSKERISLFTKILPPNSVYEKRDEKYFLKLQEIITQLLQKEGVKKHHIEIIDLCTKDHLDTFFSYRGEGKETYGEFVSVIARL